MTLLPVESIEDRDSFRAWREAADPSREALVALAHRSAMRVFPRFKGLFDPMRQDAEMPSVRLLRCLLIAGVAALAPAPEIRRAARAAAALRKGPPTP